MKQTMTLNNLASILGVDENRRVAIERTLPYAIDDVWNALIDPDAVCQWFAKWQIDPREGGDIQLDFGATVVTGKIKTLMPPNVLAYTWEQEGESTSLVQYDLVATGASETLLTIVQTKLDSAVVNDVATGWHIMLERFTEFLTTRKFAPHDSVRWQALFSAYESQEN